MANSTGSMASSKINFFYEATCHYDEDETLISSAAPIAAAAAAAAAPGTSSSSSSSASVVFKVQSILRVSVAGNPMNEFLEEKNWLEARKLFSEPPWAGDRIIIDENHWRETRQSYLELPWSITDGLITIDDDDDSNLKISETLAVLRVPRVSHQSIMDSLRLGTAAISHYAGLAPKVVVEIGEVTHITLPLIDEHGKAIYPEHRDYDGEEYIDDVDDPVQTEEEEEDIDQAQFIHSLMKFIVGARDVNEYDEDALIRDWFWKLYYAIERVAQQVTQKKEEKEKEAKDDEEEKERACPICMEIFKQNETCSEMPCCSQVFHIDCISMWTKRLKECPWCCSSLPLVLQSAKGITERLNSNRMFCAGRPGFHQQLVILWCLLAETVWWTHWEVHDAGCECGCRSEDFELVRA